MSIADALDLPPLARGLAETIINANPAVFSTFSEKGQRIFFPFGGILGQAAEAKGRRINATIGIALEEDGSPLRLPSLDDLTQLDPQDAFPYAPSFGKPQLRRRWQQMIREKNPGLGDTEISTPVVTCALTHALSMCGYLFLDEGQPLICPDLFWGNYKLIFEHAHKARIQTYPTFDGDRFNIAGLEKEITEGEPGKRVVLLNFPNNPTGFTPTEGEAEELVAMLTRVADAGYTLTVLIDDAYFGLVYEPGVSRESIFTRLATAHERLLAVKIDGATKEDYVWGFRVGFITYGVKGGTAELYDALEAKTAGAVRGNVSNAPHLAQSLLLKTYEMPGYAEEKRAKFAVMAARYAQVKAVLAKHPEYAEQFEPLPFNSGYFMCVRPKSAAPEAVRKRLLDHYSTGVIATAGLIRVAFSSAPLSLIDDLFANLYAACQDVSAA
jgi:aspartate/methionine/tyrosine aminotransferase